MVGGRGVLELGELQVVGNTCCIIELRISLGSLLRSACTACCVPFFLSHTIPCTHVQVCGQLSCVTLAPGSTKEVTESWMMGGWCP